MKRFYKTASASPVEGGHAILLDERPVKTPERAPLHVPAHPLAATIVAEWEAQTETINPATMPVTGLANATIDRVLPALGDFRGQIAAYGGSDLLCYRAEAPEALIALQAEQWEPLLDWARQRHGASFVVTSGIMPADQPPLTLATLRSAVEALDPWLLAGAMKLVSIGGSLVGVLALLDDAIDAEGLWSAVSLDERFQLDQWGKDEEAEERLEAARAEFMDAADYCALVLRRGAV